MTPARALFGVAAVAVAGYVVIHSVSDEGPQYLGDFPSILEQSEAEPDVVPSGVDPGPAVPDPPHIDAQPVTPDTPAAPPAGTSGTRADRSRGTSGWRRHGRPGWLPAAGCPGAARTPAAVPRGLPVRSAAVRSRAGLP
jgi:hypothetical protein